MFGKFLVFLALFASFYDHPRYNDELHPETFSPRTDNVMASETDPIEELMLSMDDHATTDDLYDIQIAMIQSALSQDIRVRIYPIHDEYPSRLIHHLRDAFGGRIPDGMSVIQDYNVDTTWIRDYGPLFLKTNDSYVVVDLDYFKRRPRDDIMNYHYALTTLHYLRHIHLSSQGGNILSNGNGVCIVSDVVFVVNFLDVDDPREKAKLLRRSLNAIGCPYTIIVPSMIDDATGHADMYISWADNRTLLVGVYEHAQHPRNSVVMKNTVSDLKRVGKGLFDVIELPMPDRAKCTWVNHVHIGKEVVVPVYKNETKQYVALQIISDSTKKKVVPIFADRLVDWDGAFHCITKTKPKKN